MKWLEIANEKKIDSFTKWLKDAKLTGKQKKRLLVTYSDLIKGVEG